MQQFKNTRPPKDTVEPGSNHTESDERLKQVASHLSELLERVAITESTLEDYGGTSRFSQNGSYELSEFVVKRGDQDASDRLAAACGQRDTPISTANMIRAWVRVLMRRDAKTYDAIRDDMLDSTVRKFVGDFDMFKEFIQLLSEPTLKRVTDNQRYDWSPVLVR